MFHNVFTFEEFWIMYHQNVVWTTKARSLIVWLFEYLWIFWKLEIVSKKSYSSSGTLTRVKGMNPLILPPAMGK